MMKHLLSARFVSAALVLAALVFSLPVPTSADGLLDTLAVKKEAVSKRISSYDRTGGNSDRLRIEPGETVTIAEMDGPGIIKHIWCTIDHPDPNYRRMLVIRMYWDEEPNPSVESPLGEFFGQGWSEHYNFTSLPLAAAPAGGRALNCYFPMPFRQKARITIENQSEQACRSFYYYVDYEEHQSISPDLLYFHAWYNQEITEPAKGDENEWGTLRETTDTTTSNQENYLIIDATGEGHYVGVNYYVNCPSPMWYGEGDDMWQIDGNEWPYSLHGTGTEDYFNSSWCPKEVYQHPFFGYPRVNNDIGYLGRTHCYRFHLQDPIIFKNSLHGSIEHGHANSMTLELATVAYWYQSEPHKSFPALPAAKDRIPKPSIGFTDIHKWRAEWRKARGNETLWGNE
ncbi:MAG: DUF2961 domain-containing protein [bacterium]|jgi:hypothetical protein|nr:DUF2961 domain-containing protein [bacterium]